MPGRSFFFVHVVEARIRANTQTYNKGSRRREGQEREAQNIREQRHEEICGREREGWGGGTQGLSGPYVTGTFRKESREFEGGVFGVD